MILFLKSIRMGDAKMNEMICLLKSENVQKTIKDVRFFLADLKYEYPEHEKWYDGMVQELESGMNREIIAAYDDRNIIGVAILKKSNLERKICSLRVAKEYQCNGIGTELVKRSFEFLETDKPIITVSQTKKMEFQKLFNYFDFSLERVYHGKYLPSSSEYCYNGILLPESILQQNKKQVWEQKVMGI